MKTEGFKLNICVMKDDKFNKIMFYVVIGSFAISAILLTIGIIFQIILN